MGNSQFGSYYVDPNGTYTPRNQRPISGRPFEPLSPECYELIRRYAGPPPPPRPHFADSLNCDIRDSNAGRGIHFNPCYDSSFPTNNYDLMAFNNCPPLSGFQTGSPLGANDNINGNVPGGSGPMNNEKNTSGVIAGGGGAGGPGAAAGPFAGNDQRRRDIPVAAVRPFQGQPTVAGADNAQEPLMQAPFNKFPPEANPQGQLHMQAMTGNEYNTRQGPTSFQYKPSQPKNQTLPSAYSKPAPSDFGRAEPMKNDSAIPYLYSGQTQQNPPVQSIRPRQNVEASPVRASVQPQHGQQPVWVAGPFQPQPQLQWPGTGDDTPKQILPTAAATPTAPSTSGGLGGRGMTASLTLVGYIPPDQYGTAPVQGVQSQQKQPSPPPPLFVIPTQATSGNQPAPQQPQPRPTGFSAQGPAPIPDFAITPTPSNQVGRARVSQPQPAEIPHNVNAGLPTPMAQAQAPERPNTSQVEPEPAPTQTIPTQRLLTIQTAPTLDYCAPGTSPTPTVTQGQMRPSQLEQQQPRPTATAVPTPAPHLAGQSGLPAITEGQGQGTPASMPSSLPTSLQQQDAIPRSSSQAQTSTTTSQIHDLPQGHAPASSGAPPTRWASTGFATPPVEAATFEPGAGAEGRKLTVTEANPPPPPVPPRLSRPHEEEVSWPEPTIPPPILQQELSTVDDAGKPQVVGVDGESPLAVTSMGTRPVEYSPIFNRINAETVNPPAEVEADLSGAPNAGSPEETQGRSPRVSSGSTGPEKKPEPPSATGKQPKRKSSTPSTTGPQAKGDEKPKRKPSTAPSHAIADLGRTPAPSQSQVSVREGTSPGRDAGSGKSPQQKPSKNLPSRTLSAVDFMKQYNEVSSQFVEQQKKKASQDKGTGVGAGRKPSKTAVGPELALLRTPSKTSIRSRTSSGKPKPLLRKSPTQTPTTSRRPSVTPYGKEFPSGLITKRGTLVPTASLKSKKDIPRVKAPVEKRFTFDSYGNLIRNNKVIVPAWKLPREPRIIGRRPSTTSTNISKPRSSPVRSKPMSAGPGKKPSLFKVAPKCSISNTNRQPFRPRPTASTSAMNLPKFKSKLPRKSSVQKFTLRKALSPSSTCIVAKPTVTKPGSPSYPVRRRSKPILKRYRSGTSSGIKKHISFDLPSVNCIVSTSNAQARTSQRSLKCKRSNSLVDLRMNIEDKCKAVAAARKKKKRADDWMKNLGPADERMPAQPTSPPRKCNLQKYRVLGENSTAPFAPYCEDSSPQETSSPEPESCRVELPPNVAATLAAQPQAFCLLKSQLDAYLTAYTAAMRETHEELERELCSASPVQNLTWRTSGFDLTQDATTPGTSPCRPPLLPASTACGIPRRSFSDLQDLCGGPSETCEVGPSVFPRMPPTNACRPVPQQCTVQPQQQCPVQPQQQQFPVQPKPQPSSKCPENSYKIYSVNSLKAGPVSGSSTNVGPKSRAPTSSNSDSDNLTDIMESAITKCKEEATLDLLLGNVLRALDEKNPDIIQRSDSTRHQEVQAQAEETPASTLDFSQAQSMAGQMAASFAMAEETQTQTSGGSPSPSPNELGDLGIGITDMIQEGVVEFFSILMNLGVVQLQAPPSQEPVGQESRQELHQKPAPKDIPSVNVSCRNEVETDAEEEAESQPARDSALASYPHYNPFINPNENTSKDDTCSGRGAEADAGAEDFRQDSGPDFETETENEENRDWPQQRRLKNVREHMQMKRQKRREQKERERAANGEAPLAWDSLTEEQILKRQRTHRRRSLLSDEFKANLEQEFYECLTPEEQASLHVREEVRIRFESEPPPLVSVLKKSISNQLNITRSQQSEGEIHSRQAEETRLGAKQSSSSRVRFLDKHETRLYYLEPLAYNPAAEEESAPERPAPACPPHFRNSNSAQDPSAGVFVSVSRFQADLSGETSSNFYYASMYGNTNQHPTWPRTDPNAQLQPSLDTYSDPMTNGLAARGAGTGPLLRYASSDYSLRPLLLPNPSSSLQDLNQQENHD